ncbi:MAG: PHP domain-containing protein [Bacilli bacterium]|nr:PHP domain-containing protein [Bacilli bacterium]
MEKLIDLHIHTNCSDGALSPKEIIDTASRNGVSVIAIADHDTIDAYTEELSKYAKEKQIKLIPAVEISTKTKKAGIHVLGYNFDIHHQGLNKKLSSLRNATHDYLFRVSEKLNQLGYVLHTEELDQIEAVTKAHIAKDVIHNDKNKEILLKNFDKIPQMGEFIETVMNEGCPAYVKKETITPKEAAELIRNAGGKVILAHPVAYQYEDHLSDEEILSLVQEMKADGIEANYIYIDRNNQKINEINKWNTIAKENHLMVTIGSDFHQQDGIHPEIGLIHENLNLEDDFINSIISYLINQ